MREQQQQRYRELYEHTSDGVFLLDVMEDGRFRIMGFNPAEVRLIGLSNDEVYGKYVDELFPPEVSSALIANYARCAQRAAPISYEEVLDVPAGRRSFNTTLVPVLDAGGRVHRIIGVAHDVTKERAAVEALRVSEERFRQLAENIREVFWMRDVESNELLYISPGYELVWGLPPDTIMANPMAWRAAIHPDDRARVEALDPRTRLEPTDSTYRIVRADSSERWVRARTFPVRRADGETYRVVGVADDITELVRAEERLRQAQKLEAVGQLAGGVAHDFNNLLMVVLSYSDLLMHTLAPDDPRYADLSEIRRAAESAADLTRQLLAFSRKQVIQPKLIDLAQTFLPMAKMLQRLIGEGVELVLNTAPSTGTIRADASQVEQIIVNLAVNARDAMMPDGGKLVLETSNVDIRATDELGIPAGPYVLLTAKDTGAGMDGPTQARIFEPFFTTKEVGRGTGLGLATVFGIVEQSGGTIRVESAPGKGSTFSIYFPRVADVLPAGASEASASTAGGKAAGNETILLVEDDHQVREATRAILRRLGYGVLDAQNAGEALLSCEQHQGPIHLLLTDVVMPRMSGRQLAERLAPLRPEMKVLYMSGYPDASFGDGNVIDEGTAFIAKPVSPEALGAKVREVIDARR